MVLMVLLLIHSWLLLPPSFAAVKLESISVPAVVQNGSVDHVILDCPYSLTNRGEREGLVLKWYLNSKTVPIYQWIPPHHPRGLGSMRRRIDLDFEVTRDPYTRHRALYLVRPTVDMSGVYTCKVSTLDNEVSASSRMVVYSPPRDVRMMARNLPMEGAVNISCIVEHSFPRPRLALYHGQGLHRLRLKGVREGDVQFPDGAYRVIQYIVLDHASLTLENLFECEVALPHTDYRVTHRTVYSPGLPAVLARANSGAEGSLSLPLLLIIFPLLISYSCVSPSHPLPLPLLLLPLYHVMLLPFLTPPLLLLLHLLISPKYVSPSLPLCPSSSSRSHHYFSSSILFSS